MTSEELRQDLCHIFRKVFQEPALELRPEMTAADVARWDSLTHVEMIAAVEAHFGVRFKLKDVTKMKNVGDLIDVLSANLGVQ